MSPHEIDARAVNRLWLRKSTPVSAGADIVREYEAEVTRMVGGFLQT
jgi:hypothetical protein